MSQPSEADVLAILRTSGLIAPGDAAPRLVRLAGGWWNDVWRLRAPGRDWVVKVFADDAGSTLFPMLPDEEARVLELLRGRAIAPEPVAYLPRAAEGDALLAGVAGAATLRARRQRWAPLPSSAPALLHTDVGPANLIAGPAGLRLVDWQCPALGDPAEDLFSFCAPAFQILSDMPPLSPGQRRTFLRAYDDPSAVRRLEKLWPAFSYRMAAYCCRRAAELESPDPAGSRRYQQALAATLQ